MDSAAVIKEVESHCQTQGLRLTPTRKRVLELVLAAEGPVKAYELLDQLKAEQPKAAPPTVYRALDFLLENHFIHRLETLNSFVSCFHPDHQHEGQFLICECCEAVIEVHDHEIDERLRQAAVARNFKPRRQVLEIYGSCQDCQTDCPGDSDQASGESDQARQRHAPIDGGRADCRHRRSHRQGQTQGD
ncbi:MAG: Fur family transcriptional regulator [Pseudomonadota bacterium]